MYILKKYYAQKKYIFFFLGILVVIGLITGGYLVNRNYSFLEPSIFSFRDHLSLQDYSYLFYHFFFLVICFILSFFVIGIPLLITLVFYEGVSIGFLISVFFCPFGLSGALFGCIFYVITKGFYFVALILFFLKCLEIARKMIGKMLYQTDPSMVIRKQMKAIVILIVLVMINDILLFVCARHILLFFHFLLQ